MSQQTTWGYCAENNQLEKKIHEKAKYDSYGPKIKNGKTIDKKNKKQVKSK